MNTVTRMLLIPEDQYKDPTNLLLESKIPNDRKIRLLNNLMLKKMDKKPEQINLKAIINSNLTAEQKARLIDKIQTKTVELGIQSEEPDNLEESIFSTPRSEFATPASQQTSQQTTPVSESSSSRTNLMKSFATESPKLETDVDTPPPISPRKSKMQPFQPDIGEALTLGIRSIPGLINGRGQVIKPDGTTVFRSNLLLIVNYLLDNQITRKPNGLDLVVAAIRQNKPSLLNFITNPGIQNQDTWQQLQQQSEASTSRQIVPEASEESEDYTRPSKRKRL